MTAKTSSPFLFPACVAVAVAVSMARPTLFDKYFGYDLKGLIVPLIQIIMFGMGAKLSANDFIRVFVMPWPVFIGVTLHYTVMPLTGFAIATLFGFPPEVAAGVILVGSVSSGAASNLIAYLSGANVALAVTITACSTIVSPLLTPFLMKTLAGRLVPIDIFAMMFSIANMIIVPIALGLFANHLLFSNARWTRRRSAVNATMKLSIAASAWSFLFLKHSGPWSETQIGLGLSSAFIALICFFRMPGDDSGRPMKNPDWFNRILPIISMVGICVIVAIITSRSRDKLLSVGIALIIAAILHNAIGYILGYWLARAVRLDEITSRTVAIEVGMQNAGMASGLAMTVLQSAEAALAPALFGPWMNISGALLASYWRKRPVPAPAPSEKANLQTTTP